jgi:hypothetical protein
VSYFNGVPRTLPDQAARTVDPDIERLAHVVVDGLIGKLAGEPAVPAASLLENLANQLQQAAALRRLGVVRRGTTTSGGSPGAVPRKDRAPVDDDGQRQ